MTAAGSEPGHKEDEMPDEGACPNCGGALAAGFGLAFGGYGAYTYCLDCEWHRKFQEAAP